VAGKHDTEKKSVGASWMFK
jgi:hypothetical protein